VAIEPHKQANTTCQDDNAARGIHPFGHLSYCSTLRRFAVAHAGSFDVVLEKGWRLSGLLTAAFQRLDVPGIVVENDVRLWAEPLNSVRQAIKYGLHVAADRVATSCSRRASLVVAETAALKDLLVSRRKLGADRVRVVPLGVDHSLFHPMDQAEARRALGIR